MAENYSVKRTDPSNAYPMGPLSSQPFGGMNGIECLRTLDSLFVKQISSLTEAIFRIATEAKYDIFNDRNERIFQAFETSTFCQRFCCAARRRLTLRIVDNQNQEIILIRREFKCCSGCCWCANTACCSQEVTVESPPGTLIGTVSQEGSCWRLRFAIKDVNDNTVLTVIGPGCICDGPASCCCENKFVLLGTDGVTEIGAIQKKYRGYLAEAMTSADAYLLHVPRDLDVKMKAVTLSALFLIDFMVFGTVPQRDNN